MTRHRIPRLGVTGGIGSGKSTAVAYLGELGGAVVSADDLVHRLLDEAEIVRAVDEHFAGRATADGRVDRRALARIAFEDDEALRWLEGLTHPRVVRMIEEWARRCERSAKAPPLLVAEVPLLFETELATAFDYVLLVTAPEPLRRKRLAAKMTGSEFARRARRQMDEQTKAARADFVFENAGSRRRLRDFLAETYASIIAESRETRSAGSRS